MGRAEEQREESSEWPAQDISLWEIHNDSIGRSKLVRTYPTFQ